MENLKIFEMPVPGYFGFPAFALEWFTMYVFVRRLVTRGGRAIADVPPATAASRCDAEPATPTCDLFTMKDYQITINAETAELAEPPILPVVFFSANSASSAFNIVNRTDSTNTRP